MTFDDIPVRRRSQSDIEAIALQWGQLGTAADRGVVDILHLYSGAGVELLRWPDDEMGDDIARAAPSANRVFARQALLSAVRGGDLHAKMDLAHELGHVALHRGPEMKARKLDGNEKVRFIPEEESAEAQAWKFARALTMPLAMVEEGPSAAELAIRCKVPIEHARLRLSEAALLPRKRQLPTFVQPFLDKGKTSRELAEERKAREAREQLQVWNKAIRIPGDRTNSRLCHRGKWRVLWSEYKQMTECGWVVREGKIVAWMDIRQD